jgi:hypothetical protein
MAMTGDQKMKREDVSLLLPWNANGTFDANETAIVEKALADDSSVGKEFDLILEDMVATRELAEREEVPASMSLRFQAAMEEQVKASEKRVDEQADTTLALWLQQLFDMVLPRERLAYAAAAAALMLVAVQSGVIATLLHNTSDGIGQYQTASDKGKNVAGGTVYLVELSKAALIDDVVTFLNNNGGRIINGPLPGNLFRVRFSQGDDKTDRNLEEKLRGQTNIFISVYPEN